MMLESDAFQQFLATSRADISEVQFVGNLVLAAVLAFILRQIYVRYGRSLSNRQVFASNFILLTMTTMLIITIVKSSLALSLGLVGALSIVRFRAAIKEPEELAYLFLTIAVGLGLGAGQTIITLVGFVIIGAILVIAGMRRTTEPEHNLFLSVTTNEPKKTKLGDIVETLNENCGSVNLRRVDETENVLEASFLVEFDGYQQLEKSKARLHELDQSMKLVFLDNKGAA